MNKKTPFLELNHIEQKASVEAIIFSSEEVVTLEYLFRTLILGGDNSKQDSFTINFESDKQAENPEECLTIDFSFFKNLIDEINQELMRTERPFEIVNVSGGYQFATRREYGSLVHQLTKSKAKKRLSQASMETLAIISYKQPITKPEIEQIRGVNCNEIVNSLIVKNIVEVKGRKDTLGKPLTFGTTSHFLKLFGINNLEELPKLREIDEFSEGEINPPSKMEVLIDASTPSDKIDELQKTIDNDFSIASETPDKMNSRKITLARELSNWT